MRLYHIFMIYLLYSYDIYKCELCNFGSSFANNLPL